MFYFRSNSFFSSTITSSKSFVNIHYFEKVISINKMLLFIHSSWPFIVCGGKCYAGSFQTSRHYRKKGKNERKTGQNIVIKNSSKNYFNIRWKALQTCVTGRFFQSIFFLLTFASYYFIYRYLDENQRWRCQKINFFWSS